MEHIVFPLYRNHIHIYTNPCHQLTVKMGTRDMKLSKDSSNKCAKETLIKSSLPVESEKDNLYEGTISKNDISYD